VGSKLLKLYDRVYDCILEVHEPLYFASLEVGREVKILPYLHNYALTYAIFLNNPIFGKKLLLEHTNEDIAVPKYERDLSILTELSTYVTPAWPLSFSIEKCTWGAQSEKVEWKIPKAALNIPPTMVVYEFVKPNSSFRFFIFSNKNLKIPSIIRLGKGRARCKVISKEAEVKCFENNKDLLTSPFLTPWDIPSVVKFALAGKIVTVPPSRLLEDAKWDSSSYYQVTSEDKKFYFPPMYYFARQG